MRKKLRFQSYSSTSLQVVENLLTTQDYSHSMCKNDYKSYQYSTLFPYYV